MRTILIIATILLSSCISTDHTNAPKDVGTQGPNYVLLNMCQKKENRKLYQCIDICKKYYCTE